MSLIVWVLLAIGLIVIVAGIALGIAWVNDVDEGNRHDQ